MPPCRKTRWNISPPMHQACKPNYPMRFLQSGGHPKSQKEFLKSNSLVDHYFGYPQSGSLFGVPQSGSLFWVPPKWDTISGTPQKVRNQWKLMILDPPLPSPWFCFIRHGKVEDFDHFHHNAGPVSSVPIYPCLKRHHPGGLVWDMGKWE